MSRAAEPPLALNITPSPSPRSSRVRGHVPEPQLALAEFGEVEAAEGEEDEVAGRSLSTRFREA